MALSEGRHSISEARKNRDRNLRTARAAGSHEEYKKDFVGVARHINHEIVGRLRALGFYKREGQNH